MKPIAAISVLFCVLNVSLLMAQNTGRNAPSGNTNNAGNSHSTQQGNPSQYDRPRGNGITSRGDNRSNTVNGPRGGNGIRNNTSSAQSSSGCADCPRNSIGNQILFNLLFGGRNQHWADRDPSPSRTITRNNICSNSPWTLGFSTNAAFPVLRFGKKENPADGYANIGINVNLDFKYNLFRKFRFGLEGGIINNQFDHPFYPQFVESRIPDQNAITQRKYEGWNNLYLTWGLDYSFYFHRFSVDLKGNIGAAFISFPKATINYTQNNMEYTQEYSSFSASLFYGGGVNIYYYFTPCFSAFINLSGYTTRANFNGLHEKISRGEQVLTNERISDPFTKKIDYLLLGAGFRIRM
jgi:hypothetical protein